MPWGRRFLPDAGEVNPDLLAELGGHALAPDAVEQLLALVQPRLRRLFRTAQPVAVAPAPAGILREIGLRATIEHRVLVLVAGPDSAALADTAEALGVEVIRMMVHPGRTPESDQLERFLASPPVDSVALVHSEAGTGALAPLAALAQVVRGRPDLLLFVDATGSLGATPVETDAWGLDLVLAASDGPLALPAGLSFAAASSRLVARARTLVGRGVLLDLLTHLTAAAEGTVLTPVDPVLAVALDRQLERIDREGLPNRWARHQMMAEMVERWASGRKDVALVAAPGRRSPAVSCLELAVPFTGSKVAEALSREGWQVAPGEGQGSERLLRLGHMGEIGPEQLAPLLQALGRRLDTGSDAAG
jgi:alanine-glyoxylate transaminase/serine-glyoxylate transaminase/serine-pyruvate transaminase